MATSASNLIRRLSTHLPRPLLHSFSLGPSLAPSIPRFSFGASVELMAVPKKKVSRHKKGLRNGPKALKPVPVIIRCMSCGRVKLPHFYCCSGDRGNSSSV
ncbi:uncharacterized protein LOC109721161 [Ananas comosus]|uniref:Large ribosomal subunit protein bL32m n=1 Tax=Ananas comosus TaxID=4615 RepID=A0A6P5GFQ0_ANACO|nr:uncharacterized protein LOC109721161 [Ananas comosus]XP_020104195.1 uncharacterized protein LOC109721161 [Ananas comosus]